MARENADHEKPSDQRSQWHPWVAYIVLAAIIAPFFYYGGWRVILISVIGVVWFFGVWIFLGVIGQSRASSRTKTVLAFVFLVYVYGSIRALACLFARLMEGAG